MRLGRLVLLFLSIAAGYSEVIATFFKASIDGIIETILEHRQKHNICVRLRLASADSNGRLLTQVLPSGCLPRWWICSK